MRVDVRRYATLAGAASGRPAGTPEPLDVDAGETVSGLLARLALSPDAVHLVMINGRIVHDRGARLADGDRVALFPPVGGG